jgi:hypothetical protein
MKKYSCAEKITIDVLNAEKAVEPVQIDREFLEVEIIDRDTGRPDACRYQVERLGVSVRAMESQLFIFLFFFRKVFEKTNILRVPYIGMYMTTGLVFRISVRADIGSCNCIQLGQADKEKSK